jgi:hypothetical protein
LGQKFTTNTSSTEIIKNLRYLQYLQQNHERNLDKTAGDISSTGDIISPANKIPPVENHQNHAQKSTTGDTGDILPSSGAAPTTAITEQNEPDQLFEFQCYYCDSFKTNSNDEYEDHTIKKHGQGHPCYPSKADLERLRLKAQEKSWEI